MAEITGKPLGPCRISFGGVDLGFTTESVTFRYSENHSPVNVAQLGTTNMDEIQVGATCEVECSLTRTQIATLSSLLAGADNSGSSGNVIEVRNVTGNSLYDNAKELILKPIIGNNVADSNPNNWLRVYKAHPKADLEIAFNNSDQRECAFTFVGYPDLTSGKNFRLWGNKP